MSPDPLLARDTDRPLTEVEASALRGVLARAYVARDALLAQVAHLRVREPWGPDDPSLWLSHTAEAQPILDVERLVVADAWARDVDHAVIELIAHVGDEGFLRCFELVRQASGPIQRFPSADAIGGEYLT